MRQELVIENPLLDDYGDVHVTISGHRFWSGEKYTILELGWAVYVAEEEEDVSEEWMSKHGEIRPAEDDWNELASRHGMLVSSHPVLVALALRAWWHRNGQRISTAPAVVLPTFAEAVDEVRGRKILNDFNQCLAGTVPGLSRWSRNDS